MLTVPRIKARPSNYFSNAKAVCALLRCGIRRQGVIRVAPELHHQQDIGLPDYARKVEEIDQPGENI
jgi:hypothetical protein